MGAAFALLAYMLLLSGLIQGNFLPALDQYPPPLLEGESNVPRLGSAFALRLGMPKSAGDLALDFKDLVARIDQGLLQPLDFVAQFCVRHLVLGYLIVR